MKDKNNQQIKKKKKKSYQSTIFKRGNLRAEGYLWHIRVQKKKNQNQQNPSHLKGSSRRSHSKATYKLLDGFYNTLREEKIQRYLLKKQNDVLVYYEEDEVFSRQ